MTTTNQDQIPTPDSEKPTTKQPSQREQTGAPTTGITPVTDDMPNKQGGPSTYAMQPPPIDPA